MSDSIIRTLSRRALLPALLMASGAALAHHGQAEIGATALEAFVAGIQHWLTQPDHLLAVAGIGTLLVQLRPGSIARKLIRRLSGR